MEILANIQVLYITCHSDHTMDITIRESHRYRQPHDISNMGNTGAGTVVDFMTLYYTTYL